MEKVISIKNHQLETQVLGQKFLVQRQGTLLKNEDLVFRFVVDKGRAEEYFLEICDGKGGKALRQIAVCDIEAIEPIQGTRFALLYQASPLGANIPLLGGILAQKQGKIPKEEQFTSRHLAELKDAFDQILEIIEEKDRELELMADEEAAGDASESGGDEQEEQKFDPEGAFRQV